MSDRKSSAASFPYVTSLDTHLDLRNTTATISTKGLQNSSRSRFFSLSTLDETPKPNVSLSRCLRTRMFCMSRRRSLSVSQIINCSDPPSALLFSRKRGNKMTLHLMSCALSRRSHVQRHRERHRDSALAWGYILKSNRIREEGASTLARLSSFLPNYLFLYPTFFFKHPLHFILIRNLFFAFWLFSHWRQKHDAFSLSTEWFNVQ